MSVFVTIEILEEAERDEEGIVFTTALSYTHGLEVSTVCAILRAALEGLEEK